MLLLLLFATATAQRYVPDGEPIIKLIDFQMDETMWKLLRNGVPFTQSHDQGGFEIRASLNGEGRISVTVFGRTLFSYGVETQSQATYQPWNKFDRNNREGYHGRYEASHTRPLLFTIQPLKDACVVIREHFVETKYTHYPVGVAGISVVVAQTQFDAVLHMVRFPYRADRACHALSWLIGCWGERVYIYEYEFYVEGGVSVFEPALLWVRAGEQYDRGVTIREKTPACRL